MRVPHPPSRLSPPPGTSMHELLAGNDGQPSNGAQAIHSGGSSSAGGAGTKRKDDERVPKRGYRACVHCRLRKAKCDLGDVNSPSEPPCTRCRREQRNCIFLPSKRRRKTLNDDELKPEVYPAASGSQQGGGSSFAAPAMPSFSGAMPPTHGGMPRPQMPGQVDMDSLHYTAGPSTGPSTVGSGGGVGGSVGMGTSGAQGTWEQPKLSPLFDPPTNTTTSSFASGSTSSPNMATKRRRRSDPDATRRIVVASFNNETDALEILAQAATHGDGETADKSEGEERVDRHKRVAWAEQAPRPIQDFVLIKRGVLDERRLELLVGVFFQHHHPVLPIFQTVRIPSNRAQLAALAHDDPFLLSAIVCVASRHHPGPGMKEVHERTYALIRETLTDYACAGLQTSIGFVEGVLILAENLPRERMGPNAADMAGPQGEVQGLHGTENRRSWALTGTAIRAAYGLGLDRLALEDGERDADLERARGVWTWCYLYDRTLGLRTGLAFWSRGPAICFQGLSDISQTGETASRRNFPYMMQPTGDTPGGGQSPGFVDTNDSAAMMQAYMELTQIMTNAHDILFSTPSRTTALVRKGEYFKFLDHFRRALESFCVVWKDKQWRLDSVRELTWCTYHFVRLYVAAFAFQATVQRAQERNEEERLTSGAERPSVVTIFPRGSATSPDAVYIYESIDAANEILGICLRLGHSGVLRYLPSRYLINFAYSGTFALKAAYSGAVSKTDQTKTVELVERVCTALLLASPDKDHPACRYGQMLRILSRRLTEMSDASGVPSRFPSPEPNAPGTDLAPLHLGLHALTEIPPRSGTPGNDDLPGGGGSDMMNFAVGQNPGGLFDVPADMDVGFNLEGFWDDFTLTDNGGFPFR